MAAIMTEMLSPDRLGDFQLAEPLKGRRIVVAMSGGVDSSVVAALAVRSGAEVIGVPLQLYDHGAEAKRVGACCAGQEIRDARAVAHRRDGRRSWREKGGQSVLSWGVAHDR